MTYQIPSIFELTDETTFIDLVHGANSIFMESWQPTAMTDKGGGVMASSPLASGSRLVFRTFANVVESLELYVSANSADAAIRRIQQIRRLMEKAMDYWATDHQHTPVYITAQGIGETNVRYGHVVRAVIANDAYPYGQPFKQADGRTVWKFPLKIEHLGWKDTVPGTGTAIETSAVEAYDGRNMGNVNSSGTRTPTTAQEVYFANKYAIANLTDIYIFDGTSFGSNLLDAGLPHDLIDKTPTLLDFTYFGIDTSLTDSGPFDNLVFNVGFAAVYDVGAGLTWQYYNGAWVTLTTIRDNTNGGTGVFDTAGVNSVNFDPPSDWTTTAINGITAYWVRLDVDTGEGSGITTIPTQVDRNVYSCVWPYIEVQSTEIAGDIEALGKLLLNNIADANAVSAIDRGYVQKTLIGVRSEDRGTGFRAFINLSDEQNGSDITISDATYASGVEAPTGRYVSFQAVGSGAATAAKITIDPPDAYFGRFRVLIRATLGGATHTFIQLKSSLGDDSKLLAIDQSSTVFFVHDMGEMSFPGTPPSPNDTFDKLVLTLEITASGAAAAPIKLYDIAFIPVDEWAGQFVGAVTGLIPQNLGESPDGNTQLVVDSVIEPRRYLRGLIQLVSNGEIIAMWESRGNGPLSFPASKVFRVYFFSYGGEPIAGNNAVPWIGMRTETEAQIRYLSMRADR